MGLKLPGEKIDVRTWDVRDKAPSVKRAISVWGVHFVRSRYRPFVFLPVPPLAYKHLGLFCKVSNSVLISWEMNTICGIKEVTYN